MGDIFSTGLPTFAAAEAEAPEHLGIAAVAFYLALVLILLMGRRYLRTRKPMPALLIVVLSVIVAVVQIYIILFVGLGNEHL